MTQERHVFPQKSREYRKIARCAVRDDADMCVTEQGSLALFVKNSVKHPLVLCFNPPCQDRSDGTARMVEGHAKPGGVRGGINKQRRECKRVCGRMRAGREWSILKKGSPEG